MDANEMIVRYVNEVGRHLPRKSRADIEMELQSLLQDALDERAASAGHDPTPKMASAVLQEFGKPEEMASQYHGEQYLIGPELFPVYKLVLTIVLSILAVIFAIGLFSVILRNGGPMLGQALWNWFLELAQTVVFDIGLITVIFVVLERTYRGKVDVANSSTWDPMDLPAVKDPDRINRGEMIFGIFWTVFVIVVFNFYPKWLGISAGDGVVFPLFALEFGVHIPWMTASWVMEVLLRFVVVRQGRWQAVTRWLEFAIGLFGLYVGYRIVTGGPILAWAGLNSIVRFGIWIGLTFGALKALERLWKLLFGRRPFRPIGDLKSRIA